MNKQYVIAMIGEKRYLIWKSESVDSQDWTEDIDQAFRYPTSDSAYEDILMMELNAYVKEIKDKT